ncbi:MAG: 50S ribosomal protein L11 methyltransferase [Simkaniaceae bacterium]|nr:MAG: 50S ribosomal protein L11 methyltransferase [Simkaniaceae bacterium]
MIDWKEQWELHAPTFKEGYAHVKLKGNLSFRMKPGPGFGDLSHPTTRLMLEMLPDKIEGTVIDVGCGSGVLSLAAKLLGANEVIGIDIDEGAIRHAKENAELNGLDCYFGKKLPSLPQNPLILMNMISSEQKIAWSSLPEFKSYRLIVSGYPLNEKEPHFNGALIQKGVLEGWKGFLFEKISS